MQRSFFLSLLTACSFALHAQKFYTKNGTISFFSKAPLENISAGNNQVMSTFDAASGQLQFSVLIKAFHFRKSLMEEHFNENYLESDKFPKATFKGIIQELKIDLGRDGNYAVNVSGDMSIHGISRKLTAPGTVTVTNGIASAKSTFKIKLADYKITIPAIVKDNISETVEITVSCVYDKKM